MNGELLKILNIDYDTINLTILNIEKEVSPFEEIFANVEFTYEQNHIKHIDAQFKSILVKTKNLNKVVEEYENKIRKNTNENIKRIFLPRVKILKQKYASLLKKIVSVNEKYKSHAKNANKFAFIKNEDIVETEEKYNPGQNSTVSSAQLTVNINTVTNDNVINAYRDVASRNVEVEKLANDVRELFEMFQDFAVLVNAQHEDIITIETTIENAQQKVESGNKKLVDAIKAQREARKKSCCVAFICIIVLIIVGSVVGGVSYKFS